MVFRRLRSRKGFLDELMDDVLTVLLLFVAFLIAFLVLSSGEKEAFHSYQESFLVAQDQQLLNTYFRHPITSNKSLADFVGNKSLMEPLFPPTAYVFFNNWYPSGWRLILTYPPDNTTLKAAANEEEFVSTPGSRNFMFVTKSFSSSATLYFPSVSGGLIKVVLFTTKR